jgi:hypothetical protein
VTVDGDLSDMPGWPQTQVIMPEFDCFDGTDVNSAELENILQVQRTFLCWYACPNYFAPTIAPTIFCGGMLAPTTCVIGAAVLVAEPLLERR